MSEDEDVVLSPEEVLSFLKESNRLRKELASTVREADRARGAAEQLFRQLKEEFGTDDIDDLQKMVKRERREYERQVIMVREETARFREEFGQRFEEG